MNKEEKKEIEGYLNEENKKFLFLWHLIHNGKSNNEITDFFKQWKKKLNLASYRISFPNN